MEVEKRPQDSGDAQQPVEQDKDNLEGPSLQIHNRSGEVIEIDDQSMEQISFTKGQNEVLESFGSNPEKYHLNFSTTEEDLDFHEALHDFSDHEDSYDHELHEVQRYE